MDDVKRRRGWIQRLPWPVFALLAAVLALAATWMYASAIAALMSIAETAMKWAAKGWGHRVLTLAGFALVALIFWAVRSVQRHVYGLLEIAFGLASAWFILGLKSASTEVAFAGLMGALYVVIRGIDNWKVGLKELAEFDEKERARQAEITAAKAKTLAPAEEEAVR